MTSNHDALRLLTDDEDLVNDEPGSADGDFDGSGDGGVDVGGATPVPPSDKYPGMRRRAGACERVSQDVSYIKEAF